MKRIRTLSFVTQVTIGLGLALAGVGTLMAVANYFIVTIPISRQLQTKAQQTCQRLVNVLREDVWNMDDTSLKRYFAHHPRELSGLVSVRILTEFDDPIFTQQFSEEPDVIACRQEVYYNHQLIGFVEVSISGEQVRLIRETTTRSTLLIISSGLVAILLAAIFLIRVIFSRTARKLQDALKRIEDGDYDYRLPPAPSRETEVVFGRVRVMASRIAERTAALKQENQQREKAERALLALTNNLEREVSDRTLALQDAYRELQEEAAERQQVQNEILAISDRERQRIGRDLHDSLGQQLTGVALLLAVLRKSLEREGAPEAESAAALGEQMKKAISEARIISHGLMPLNLQIGGVVAALQRLTEETKQMYGVSCTFKTSPNFDISSDTVAINIYRIVQEAIHNARQHGRASHIVVTLNRLDHETLQGAIVIEDNGSGISEEKISCDGMGLRIMRYRAETMGGTFSIHRTEAGGTLVRVTFQNSPQAD